MLIVDSATGLFRTDYSGRRAKAMTYGYELQVILPVLLRTCAGHETCCMASKTASSSFQIVQGRTCRASASAGPSTATVKAVVLLTLAVAGMTEALNRYLRKLQRIADEHGVAVVITNQASCETSIILVDVYLEMEGGLHLHPLSNGDNAGDGIS